jgi:hypothetical protein
MQKYSINEYGYIKKNLYGHDITFNVHSVDCESPEFHERLDLTQRAVKLLVDLDRDYERAIEQIKFSDEEIDSWKMSGKDYAEYRFNSGSDLISIGVVSVFGTTIQLQTVFSGIDTAVFMRVVFEKQEDEWIIVNIVCNATGT